jgi:hypothetical protein
MALRGITPLPVSASAPVDATYVTLSTDATLTNERVLTAGTNISLVDSGPGGTITINATGGGSQAALQFQDEGINLGASGTVDTVNFTGGGVTASRAVNTVTVNIPAGGAGTFAITEVEVDFGTTPTWDASFVITDASVVNSTYKVIVQESGKAATGRATGDSLWDSIVVTALPAAGSFTAQCRAVPGPVVGKRKLHYSLAA